MDYQVFTGNNLHQWIEYFGFSEDFHSYLLMAGVTTVQDLLFVHEDAMMLADFQSKVSPEEFEKFLLVRNLTQNLISLTDPPSVPLTTGQIPDRAALLSADNSIDVRNPFNGVDRWTAALAAYSQQEKFDEQANSQQSTTTTPQQQRSQGRVIINALIDISGSMAGTKLVAVKLGLCALISQLEDTDIMNITSFSDRNQSITNGFQTIGQLKIVLPVLLSNLLDDGSTAFFDAVIDGVRHLRNYSQGRLAFANINAVTLTPEESQKAVLIALTDGEDNCSRYTSPQCLYRLSNPGINNFMFVLLAVDMGLREEQTFRSWMELRYCKQISVNIRSGSKLVQIFKEVLINRILMTDVNNTRFYQLPAVPVQPASVDGAINPPPVPVDFDREDEDLRNNRSALRDEQQVFQGLRADLLRQQQQQQARSPSNMIGDGDEDDNHSDGDLSRAVSRCNSECGDFDMSYQNDPHLRAYQNNNDSDGSESEEDMLGSPAYRGSPLFFNQTNLSRQNSAEAALTDNLQSLAGHPVIVDEVANQGQFKSSALTAALKPADNQNLPKECYCPITQQLMTDPVVCSDGHTYERVAIEEWLRNHHTSPLTNMRLHNLSLIPNYSLRNLIDALKKLPPPPENVAK